MTDFYVKPVYGFRTWTMDMERLCLTALTSPYEAWPLGKPLVSRHKDPVATLASLMAANQAHTVLESPKWVTRPWNALEASVHRSGQMKQADHEHIGTPCATCGVYAFNSYAAVVRHQRDCAPSQSLLLVRGVVAGWGQVVLCSDGWRAGKAYPLALLDWDTSPYHYGARGLECHYALHRIARRYGIPIVSTVDELETVARAYGVIPASGFGQ